MNRRHQFSLKSVFLAISVLAVLCAIAAKFGWGSATLVVLLTLFGRWLLRSRRLARIGRSVRAVLSAGLLGIMLLAVATWTSGGHLLGLPLIHVFGFCVNPSSVTLGSQWVKEDGRCDDPATPHLSGLGLSFSCQPWVYDGGDYSAGPFAGMVLPYWFFVATGAVILMRIWLPASWLPAIRSSDGRTTRMPAA